MNWNYRLCRYVANGEPLFGIREVYYHDDGSVRGITPASVDAWETVEDVKGTLARMLTALERPVLELPAEP